MQTNNGAGQEPFAPKTIPSAIDGLDAAIDGRISAAGLVTAPQLDAAIQGVRMVQLWAGSWASGSITLADAVANYRLLVMGGSAGMMVVHPSAATHAASKYLWGNGGQWHVVDNIYYIAVAGNQLTLAHSTKLLNGTAIGSADAISVVYGIK